MTLAVSISQFIVHCHLAPLPIVFPYSQHASFLMIISAVWQQSRGEKSLILKISIFD